MVDETGLQTLRVALEADGYLIEVREEDGRLDARISATAAACEDCLVPKPVMLAMLHQALGVPEQSITLRYPGERG
jgi:hypothetical protein